MGAALVADDLIVSPIKEILNASKRDNRMRTSNLTNNIHQKQRFENSHFTVEMKFTSSPRENLKANEPTGRKENDYFPQVICKSLPIASPLKITPKRLSIRMEPQYPLVAFAYPARSENSKVARRASRVYRN